MTVTLTTCKNCGTKFEAKRKTAKFCSTKCRVYNKRGIVGTVQIIDAEVTDHYIPTSTIITPQTKPADISNWVVANTPPFSIKELKYCKNGHILNSRGYCDVKGCKG